MQDHKQRFLFPDSDIRGELVQVESSVSRIIEGHNYPLPVQGLIGEAVAAVALLASTLKFKGRLALQAQGNEGELRAVARHSDGQDWSQGDVRTLIGDGNMVITIIPEQGQQYQGIVPLTGDTLAQCLEAYFQQSEQLPTRLWLASGNNRAAGLLLQRLPNQLAGTDANAQMWEHLEALATTLTLEELLNLDDQTILHRLFHDTPPQLPDAQALQFGCTCTRERNRNALLSLGNQELQTLLDEDGEVTLTCDFCRHQETFDAVDLAEMIRESS